MNMTQYSIRTRAWQNSMGRLTYYFLGANSTVSGNPKPLESISPIDIDRYVTKRRKRSAHRPLTSSNHHATCK